MYQYKTRQSYCVVDCSKVIKTEVAIHQLNLDEVHSVMSDMRMEQTNTSSWITMNTCINDMANIAGLKFGEYGWLIFLIIVLWRTTKLVCGGMVEYVQIQFSWSMQHQYKRIMLRVTMILLMTFKCIQNYSSWKVLWIINISVSSQV